MAILHTEKTNSVASLTGSWSVEVNRRLMLSASLRAFGSDFKASLE